MEIGKLNDIVMLWYLMVKSSIQLLYFRVYIQIKNACFASDLCLYQARMYVPNKLWPGAQGYPYPKLKIPRIRSTIFGTWAKFTCERKAK